MESWSLSKHKLLLLILILLVFMVEQLQGVCIEDERKALLEIKASLHLLSYRFDVSKLLITWVDHEITHGDCCDWERIKCDTATGHITGLSLSNMFLREYDRHSYDDMRWPLNFSPFLRFKELRSLDLSWNFIDHTIVSTGLDRLPSLNKLEILNLSTNHIETNIFPLLGPLTSLKTLDLSYFNGYQYSPTYGTNLTNLKKLDLSSNNLNITPSTEGCKSLMRLERLGSVSLGRALASFPHLKVLDLSENKFVGSIPSTIKSLSSIEALAFGDNMLNGSLPTGLCELKKLRELDLSNNMFDGNLPECFSRLSCLKMFDISSNQFTGILPPSLIMNLKSLEYIDFGLNKNNSLKGVLRMEYLNANM
ncbi:hypothetical protein M8C21_005103, partial [Ambrosia artemisiifolia]